MAASATKHIRKTSKSGLARIVQREGVRLTAYPDPATHAEPYTIGAGHTGGVRKGQKITMAQALRYLAQDVKTVEAVLNKFDIPDQRMYDALVSFGFNAGTGYFSRGHTMGDALHSRHWDRVTEAFDAYHVPAIIIGRRNSEKAQFARGVKALRRRQKR